MTCSYIKQNTSTEHQQNTKATKKSNNIHSGRRWDLISSTGKPEQKWLYWSPQKSCSGHQLMSLTARVIIFSWSPYLHLQIPKLNLSNFTVTSPFNREINYTCIGSHSSNKQNQKIAKLNIKHTHKKNPIIIIFIKHWYYYYPVCNF